jgi:sporulation protein YlmC with PRC-barrel domain
MRVGFTKGTAMRKLAPVALLVALLGSVSYAQQAVIVSVTVIPETDVSVTRWYRQSVYDPSDSKIGTIEDVLLDADRKASKLVIGVGGFLAIGEKNVVVPFDAVQFKEKDGNKWYPVMNMTKDQLKTAQGFKFDRTTWTWVPA